MTVRFYLKERKRKDGGRLVMLQYSHKNKRVRLSTGVVCENSKDWDKKKQRFRPGSDLWKVKNQVLEGKRRELEQAGHKCLSKGIEPYPNEVLKSIEEVKNQNLDFYEISKMYSRGEIGNKGKSESTRRNIRTTVATLKEFENEYGIMSLSGMGQRFANQFVSFCKDQGIKTSTISLKLNIIKGILNAARIELGIDVGNLFRVPRSEESEKIYFTLEEIDSLYNLSDLTEAQRVVADVFVLMCDTGLRFSDVSRIYEDGIIEEDILQILPKKTSKTGKVLHVLLSPRAKTILDQYAEMRISNQRFNKEIKILAKKAGIDSQILIGGQRLPKYEKVSAHTARRSFATNILAAGIPATTVQRALGHSSVRITEIYHIKNSEYLRTLREFWKSNR